jgi:hypothetical protein
LESSVFQKDISKESRVQRCSDNVLISKSIETENNRVIEKSLPSDYMEGVFNPAYVMVVFNRKMGENFIF